MLAPKSRKWEETRRRITLILSMFLLSLLPVFLVVAVLGNCAALIAILLMATANLVLALWPDHILRRTFGAQSIDSSTSPELHMVVKDLAKKAGIPSPYVNLIDIDQPNAMVTIGWTPERNCILLSRTLLQELPRDQVEATIGQLLTQLTQANARTEQFAAVYGSMVTLLLGGGFISAQAGRFIGCSGYGRVLATLTAPVASLVPRLCCDPDKLTAADLKSVELFDTPLALARALTRLDGLARRSQNRICECHPATAHMFLVEPLEQNRLKGLLPSRPPISTRVSLLERRAGVGLE